MNLVVDTSVIIAVITNEDHKSQLIAISKGADLIAPSSILEMSTENRPRVLTEF